MFFWNSLAFSMIQRMLAYFGYLMRRVDSLEKTLILGGIGGRRRRGRTKESKICPSCHTAVVFTDPHEPPATKFSGFLCLYLTVSFKMFYPLLFLIFLLCHQPSLSHFSAPDTSPLLILGSVLDFLLSSVFTLFLVPHIQSHDFTDGVPDMMFQNMAPCILDALS